MHFTPWDTGAVAVKQHIQEQWIVLRSGSGWPDLTRQQVLDALKQALVRTCLLAMPFRMDLWSFDLKGKWMGRRHTLVNPEPL